MKKQLLPLGLLVAMASATVFAEQGKGWTLGPAFEDGWDPEFTVAATANHMDTDITGVDSDTSAGLQISLNCPWFQPPSGLIRQQFNINKFDKDGIELTTFELNPRYYVNMSPALMVGFGPGFGYMWADADAGEDNNMWTLQLGGDVEYRQGALFLGAGARYQFTQDEELGIDNKGADNWLVQLKVGVNF